MKKKFLLVQNNAVLGDKQANFDKVEKLISLNRDEKPDFIVLPEVWSMGWSPDCFREGAEELENSETLQFLSRIAREYNSNIIAGSIITKEGTEYFNTTLFLNRLGEVVSTYHKMHLFAYDNFAEDKYVASGTKGTLVEIEGVRIGLTICYDLRFPELYREYLKSGVDVLVNVAAWPHSRKDHWYSMQKSRAIENQAFVVAVSQCGLLKDDMYNLGHSMVVNPLGEIVSSLDEQENSFCVTIDLEEIESVRIHKDITRDIHLSYPVSKVIV